MDDKAKTILIKLGLSVLILTAGVLIKTALGMTLGHSLLIAWLGNALVLLPAIGGCFYVWKNYPFQKSELPNNSIENLSSQKTVKQEEKTDSLKKKISELKEMGVLNDSEANAKIKDIERKAKKEIERKSLEERKRKIIASLDDLKKEGILSDEEYQNKIEELKKEQEMEYVCIHCNYSASEDFEFCPVCGKDDNGRSYYA